MADENFVFGAAIQGAPQVMVGTGGNIVGGALDTTGVGVVAGIPINVVSTVITVEGARAAATGAVNLMKSFSSDVVTSRACT